jgi:cyclohexanone monooxygenase
MTGIENFKGHTFHTSRWDYDYTGGTCEGNLTGLADKRVAIIGTGATAVQCIPHLGEWAKELFVFQRTPSSCDIRKNAPTSPEWEKKLQPGWHKKRVENFNVMVSGGGKETDEVADGWTDIFRNMNAQMSQNPGLVLSKEETNILNEITDFIKMEEVRERAATIVKDQATAEALKPYYRQFCKRPTFHDEYLFTYNRPNWLIHTARALIASPKKASSMMAWNMRLIASSSPPGLKWAPITRTARATTLSGVAM